jgi:hypothetical protein
MAIYPRPEISALALLKNVQPVVIAVAVVSAEMRLHS